MDIYEVVKKLTGNINPVGETHIDDERLENLKATMFLVSKLLFDIEMVAVQKDKQQFSIKQAAKLAGRFLSDVAIANEDWKKTEEE